jgi:hypothetical protein
MTGGHANSLRRWWRRAFGLLGLQPLNLSSKGLKVEGYFGDIYFSFFNPVRDKRGINEPM